MYIFTYSLVLLTIAAGIIHGIMLALRSFSGGGVKRIFCPAYTGNDAEYELRRLMRLYPNAVITLTEPSMSLYAKYFPRIRVS